MTRFDHGSPLVNTASRFTPWLPWEDRRDQVHENYKLHQFGGVYILGHFETPPRGPADHLHDAVIYVGEGNHLGRRWRQFEQSSRYRRPGHSGGHEHRKWRRRTRTPWETLHVAALPIWFDDEDALAAAADEPLSFTKRFRLHVEQAILWEITQHRHGERSLVLALLNRK